MRGRLLGKLKSWLRHQKSSAGHKPVETTASAPTDLDCYSSDQACLSPIDSFYRDLLKKDLKSFTAFALQSRSLVIRDVFARNATKWRHDYLSLVDEVDYLTSSGNRQEVDLIRLTPYERDTLISLARILLNSARSDLDFHTGVQLYELILMKYGDEALADYHKFQYVEALAELRRYDEQSRLIDRFNIVDLEPMQVELMAIDRVAYESSEQQWVSAINELYEMLGMAKVRLIEDDTLPLMDRLESASDSRVEGPKVTVLMPTFAPDEGIRTALRSLVQQTWSNLEVIVIDDGSPIEYDGILSEIEDFDPRIRLVRLATNSGAYEARNAGLAMANGDFVTVHDDDDWSHPEKLASQAEILVNSDSIVATTSAHIRATKEMQFRRINTKPKHLQTNYSSLMFRRRIPEQIGSWDTSNRGSDAEFAIRIEKNFGSASVVHMTDRPMSFSRVWTGSLTSGEMYRGYFAYSRLLFRSAFRQWHSRCKKKGTAPVLRIDQPRPYPLPTTFEPGARNKDLGVFDVLYVSDFAQQSKFASTVVQEIESSVRAGLRVGYMHIDSPQTRKRNDYSSRLFDLQLAGDVIQVAENDKAEAELMIIYDASTGMFLDQFKSTVVVRRGIVVHDKGVSLRGANARDATNVRQALNHFDRSFNCDFQIVGASVSEQLALRELVPPARLLDDEYIWNPHVTGEPGKLLEPSSVPVIGFHCFGNKYRWPENKEKFRSAYYSGDHKTKFYGLMTPVKANLGKEILPTEDIIDYKRHSLATFFESIDFWVYFPRERLEDRIWKPVLDAMHAGKVIILPRDLERLYGDAAVYTDVTGVASVVADYSQNRSKYIAQATRAQRFVAEGFDASSYIGRLTSLGSSNKER